MKTKIVLFAILITGLTGCAKGPKGGFLNNPQAVANQFLNQLYQLDFENIDKLAVGDALLQASLLQGRLSEATKEQQNAYLTLKIAVTSFDVQEEQGKAIAHFTMTPKNGEPVENRLFLRRVGKLWKVYEIAQSPVPPVSSFFVN